MALLLSAYPDLTASQQEAALISASVDLGLAGPDNAYGAGRLDLLATLGKLAPLATETPTPQLDPAVTETPTDVPTAAVTPSDTPTNLLTDTPTELPTFTPTWTVTHTATALPTFASTATKTSTPLPVPTSTSASTGQTYFSTIGSSNPPGVSVTADDADIHFYNGTAFSRSIDVTAITNPLPGGANVDGFDRVDATHFYMSFTGTVSVPGIGNVQDEDVVYYNAGAWSLYFDGSARGLSGTDLDAINIAGGVLYFSTDDSDVPPGVSGSGDDADIYSWNGASYARLVDASTAPYSLSGSADVDGLVRVDATHFYISFNADTSVPSLGTVQDEDIVYYNNGTWFVYFDGTAKGLTSRNLDLDAFDLP